MRSLGAGEIRREEKRRLLRRRRRKGTYETKWNNTHTYAISAYITVYMCTSAYYINRQCVCSKRRARTRIIFGLWVDIWFLFLFFYSLVCRYIYYTCDTFRISWCPEPIAWTHTHTHTSHSPCRHRRHSLSALFRLHHTHPYPHLRVDTDMWRCI